MRYKAILFDMDGTLLDTLADMVSAVNHILSVHGWPQRTTEEVRALVGNGARRLRSAPYRRTSPAAPSRRCWRSTGSGIRPTTAWIPHPIPVSRRCWTRWLPRG